MGEFQVQTRSADGELKYFNTVREAFEYAKTFSKVWKISWFKPTDGGMENIRFVRRGHPESMFWFFESMDEIVDQAVKEAASKVHPFVKGTNNRYLCFTCGKSQMEGKHS